MNKETKKIQKLVNKNLDNLYKAARNIAIQWAMDTIPLNVLKELVEKAKPQIEDERLKEFQNQYNATLDVIYEACEKKTEKFGVDYVPLRTLKEYIRIFKEQYKEQLESINQ